MEKSTCVSCYDLKANLVCEGCREPVCKTCARFVDEGTFTFLAVKPANLSHGAYCNQCFETRVQPEVDAYGKLVERAENIQFFTKDQGKEIRLLRRGEGFYEVKGCVDREEALLRLAFQAVEAGYDTLVDVDISSEKVRDHSYQTSAWSGRAYPARPRIGK